MILNTTEKVKYIEYICQGSVKRLEKNEALAGILRNIRSNELTATRGLEKFIVELKSVFEGEGYMHGDTVTELGNAVIESGKAWSVYDGTHLLRVIERDGMRYVIDHECDYNDSFDGTEVPAPHFAGEYKNAGDMHICNIDLEKKARIRAQSDVEMLCSYDFSQNKSRYTVRIDNKSYEFEGNTEVFDVLGNREATDRLQSELREYRDLSYMNGRVLLTRFDPANILVNGALDEIISKEKGSFSHRRGNIEIKDIRLSIGNADAAHGVLLKYLTVNAEDRYCGRSEIGRLITGFYSLFDECEDVSYSTTELIDELLDATCGSNTTAYRHLMACRDLDPGESGDGYNRSVNDLTGKTKTMKEVVGAIVGKHDGVVSVSTVSKYARSNAAISRGFSLFADVLKSEYDNVKLCLYTVEDTGSPTREINLRFYKKLDENENITHKKISRDQFDTHDRYYLVKTKKDSYWIKTTNEINALRYKPDYVGGIPRDDIRINERGQMLDFTVVALDENNVPDNVRNLLEA